MQSKQTIKEKEKLTWTDSDSASSLHIVLPVEQEAYEALELKKPKNTIN